LSRLCLVMGHIFDPGGVLTWGRGVAGGGGGGGGARQRDVRWGRSLRDGNAELVVDCIQ